MSEYQYYEFLAIDRPLNEKQLDEIRKISSRATLTSTHFVNEYQWGDFKGNPQKFIEKYYDVFLYYANWGTRQFMLKIPAGLIDEKTALEYSKISDNCLTAERVGEHIILDFMVESEDGEDWEEMEGLSLTALLPIREMLIEGDLRPLYLGFLAGVMSGGVNPKAMAPAVPEGLGKMNGGLKSLADFLRISDVLLEAAGTESGVETPRHEGLEGWIKCLPTEKKEKILIEACLAEKPDWVIRKLKMDLAKEHGKRKRNAKASGRTVGELMKAAGM